jgi:hypothetical protein
MLTVFNFNLHKLQVRLGRWQPRIFGDTADRLRIIRDNPSHLCKSAVPAVPTLLAPI